MGLFSRRDDDEQTPAAPAAAPSAAPPHPALASADAFTTAPLPELATAVLLLCFGAEDAGVSRPSGEVTTDVRELLGSVEGVDSFKLWQSRQLGVILDEATQALERSLLIVIRWGGDGRSHLALTRRGRAALDSGDPAAWLDLPTGP